MTEPAKPKTSVLAQVETSVCGLVLNNLEDMTTVAQIILQSKIAPDSFKTKEQIFVGLQTGAEIGLKPMQALNSIVVIKGKPTLWGDAPLGLVKKSGLLDYCHWIVSRVHKLHQHLPAVGVLLQNHEHELFIGHAENDGRLG